MRRMNFQPANSDARKTIHFRASIGHMQRMDGTKRNQSIGRSGTIFRAPVIYFGAETDNFRRDVIDQSRALNTHGIEEAKKSARIFGITFNFREILPAFFYQRQRFGLEEMQRLDVNVDINDWLHSRK